MIAIIKTVTPIAGPILLERCHESDHEATHQRRGVGTFEHHEAAAANTLGVHPLVPLMDP